VLAPTKVLPHALSLTPIPSSSSTGTQMSKKHGRTNVVESDDDSPLTENNSDVPAPSKHTNKCKAASTTTTSKRRCKSRK
jgi:hypothetical protein